MQDAILNNKEMNIDMNNTTKRQDIYHCTYLPLRKYAFGLNSNYQQNFQIKYEYNSVILNVLFIPSNFQNSFKICYLGGRYIEDLHAMVSLFTMSFAPMFTEQGN